MLPPMYDITRSGSMQLDMLRIVAFEADKAGYIFPDAIKHDFGINLQVIQFVLQDLVERGHIRIIMSPNRKLTDKDRARMDDEQDYYMIDVEDSFADYYKMVEQTETFHNADRAAIKPTPDTQPEKADISLTNVKVEPRSYDSANGVLNIAGIKVQIIKQPNKKGKMQESNEARLMRLLFNDVKSDFGSVPMRTVISVRQADLGAKHRKLVKSYVS